MNRGKLSQELHKYLKQIHLKILIKVCKYDVILLFSVQFSWHENATVKRKDKHAVRFCTYTEKLYTKKNLKEEYFLFRLSYM